MIERVTGKIIEKSPTFCVLDCQGIGIGLHITLHTFEQLEQSPSTNAVTLHAYLYVRDDALQLYGFQDLAEKEMFQLLISISGVGPRLALAILSSSGADEFRGAIGQEDVELLTRIPGVGKKTAQRLILELKEKIQKQAEIKQLVSVSGASEQYQVMINEAILALLSLGYKQQEARRAIDKTIQLHGNNISLEEMIKLALREI